LRVTEDRFTAVPGSADDVEEAGGVLAEEDDEQPAAAARPASTTSEEARSLALWITATSFYIDF
jgi:hypothetical protein